MLNEVKSWEKENRVIAKGSFVLFNFGWDRNWTTDYGVENQIYLKNNLGIREGVAEYLVKKKVKVVGGDIPTIDSAADPLEKALRVLLPSGIYIIENLSNLCALPPLGSLIIATPLKIKGGTGCPVGAIAFVPIQ
jgi:kynurenine formamidase